MTSIKRALLALLVSFFTFVSVADDSIIPPARLMIYDFNKQSGLGGWAIEDDVVMGGVSSGQLSLDASGMALFSGDVSLENNGGFSSVQYYFDPLEISGFTTACLRIKGDGKVYNFIVEAAPGDRHYYAARFQTGTEWEVVRIPLASLEPYRRGDRLEMPNFSGQTLAQVRLLIGNAKAEPFRLEIDALWLE